MSILAIDAPGHGLSSHYPAAGMYHFTQDIVTLRRVNHYFGWKKISILAHSLGSNNAFIYASTFPDDVEKYIGFDMLRPFKLSVRHFITTGGSDIDKFINISKKKKVITEFTYEQLVELVHKASRGSISKESSKILLARNAYETEKGSGLYKLTVDPRLKIWFFHSLPHNVLLEMSSRIKCEMLNIKFKQGMHYEKPEYYKQTVDILKSSAKRMEYHEIDGSHHGHLNTPEKVKELVTKFLLA
jgi:pimeloyl-ACP methyl ester carboxylesterase